MEINYKIKNDPDYSTISKKQKSISILEKNRCRRNSLELYTEEIKNEDNWERNFYEITLSCEDRWNCSDLDEIEELEKIENETRKRKITNNKIPFGLNKFIIKSTEYQTVKSINELL